MSESENCHNCILLIRAAGAARRHIAELVIHARAPNARPPAEKTVLVMDRIKVAIEVAGGIRPPVDKKPPEPQGEFVREGQPPGPLQMAVYRWLTRALITSCLVLLGILLWRALGGP